MQFIRLLLGIIFIIFLIVFSYFNNESVNITDLQGVSYSTPLFVVVILSVGCGGLLMWLFDLLEKFRLRRVIKKQEKKIRQLETQLENEVVEPTTAKEAGHPSQVG